jgi:hypothetical protein
MTAAGETSAAEPNAQEFAPLAPEWLLEPLPTDVEPQTELGTDDSRFEAISNLILRGEYVPAGRRSEELLHQGVYDVRVFGYYIFGVFNERGLPDLKLVFRLLIEFLTKQLPAFGPSAKKQLLTENMLLWLISGILKNVELHSTHKDSVWKQWLDPKYQAPITEAMQLCPQVQLALANFSPQSRAALRFQSLDGWLSGFGHSETGVTKRSSETNSDPRSSAESQQSKKSHDSAASSKKEEEAKSPAHDEPHEEERHQEDEDALPFGDEDEGDLAHHGDGDEDDFEEPPRPVGKPDGAFRPRTSPRSPSGTAPSEREGSSEWQRLLERLQAFAYLTEQGQYLKAAVVATDIQKAIASFDPVVYFPTLFLPYLSSFTEHMRPLEHYLNDTESVKFKVLRQLYQVDFEKFMNKD